MITNYVLWLAGLIMWMLVCVCAIASDRGKKKNLGTMAFICLLIGAIFIAGGNWVGTL